MRFSTGSSLAALLSATSAFAARPLPAAAPNVAQSNINTLNAPRTAGTNILASTRLPRLLITSAYIVVEIPAFAALPAATTAFAFNASNVQGDVL